MQGPSAQAVEFGSGTNYSMSCRRAWEAAEARDDDPVVGVSGAESYEAGGWANDWNIILVVRRRVEVGCVAPRRFVGVRVVTRMP